MDYKSFTNVADDKNVFYKKLIYRKNITWIIFTVTHDTVLINKIVSIICRKIVRGFWWIVISIVRKHNRAPLRTWRLDNIVLRRYHTRRVDREGSREGTIRVTHTRAAFGLRAFFANSFAKNTFLVLFFFFFFSFLLFLFTANDTCGVVALRLSLGVAKHDCSQFGSRSHKTRGETIFFLSFASTSRGSKARFPY